MQRRLGISNPSISYNLKVHKEKERVIRIRDPVSRSSQRLTASRIKTLIDRQQLRVSKGYYSVLWCLNYLDYLLQHQVNVNYLFIVNRGMNIYSVLESHASISLIFFIIYYRSVQIIFILFLEYLDRHGYYFYSNGYLPERKNEPA